MGMDDRSMLRPIDRASNVEIREETARLEAVLERLRNANGLGTGIQTVKYTLSRPVDGYRSARHSLSRPVPVFTGRTLSRTVSLLVGGINSRIVSNTVGGINNNQNNKLNFVLLRMHDIALS